MATHPDGVLVYKSRYGTTLQYAEWIKKELRVPKIDPERLDSPILSACEFHFLPGRVNVETLSPEDARLIDNQTPPPLTHVTQERIRPLVASVRAYGAGRVVPEAS